MEQLHFTREQVSKILDSISQKEGGIQEVLKLSLESIMRAEREIYKETYGDMSNGYRMRRTFGQGRILELRVPRTRQGQFYPLLLGMIKDQEEECRKMAFSLYGAGLTTAQVGEIFGELYGKNYSTSQISRMFEYAREEVSRWLKRPLEPYYPIVMIDATFIYTRRQDSVSKEGYYTILGVRADRTREVLAIVNFPTESACGWKEVILSIKKRGVKEIGIVVCDSLSGVESVIWQHFSQVSIQFCTQHLERNIQKYVKPKHKEEVSADFKQIFRAGDSSHTVEKAKQMWKEFTDKWGKHYPSIKRKSETERMELYFTYLKYDYRVQSMLYTTNWIERLNRDYKRTTRMRGALPNPEATILLLGYVAMTRSAYQRKIPKLNYENKKFKWEE